MYKKKMQLIQDADLTSCHYNRKLINKFLTNHLYSNQVRNQFLDLFAFCQRVYLTSQHEISNKEYCALQSVSLIQWTLFLDRKFDTMSYFFKSKVRTIVHDIF